MSLESTLPICPDGQTVRTLPDGRLCCVLYIGEGASLEVRECLYPVSSENLKWFQAGQAVQLDQPGVVQPAVESVVQIGEGELEGQTEGGQRGQKAGGQKK